MRLRSKALAALFLCATALPAMAQECGGDFEAWKQGVAAEAKAAGLVARVVAPADLLQTALEAAHTIAAYNAPAVKMAKQAVNQAFESSLAEGLRQERLLFQAAFATEGQKEGMNAFVAKRAPVFRNR